MSGGVLTPSAHALILMVILRNSIITFLFQVRLSGKQFAESFPAWKWQGWGSHVG